MDPGEDTDMDGVLDHPNTLDAKTGGPFDVIGFYERETNTLIARPVVAAAGRRRRTRWC
jgi:hypothetical protein